MNKLALVIALLSAGFAFADIAAPPPPQPEVKAEVQPAPPAPAQPTEVAAPTPAAQHPEGIEKVQMGVIQGGWGYIYACYALAIGGCFLYGLSLYTRRPRGNEGNAP